jgi:hypothetical protein
VTPVLPPLQNRKEFLDDFIGYIEPRSWIRFDFFHYYGLVNSNMACGSTRFIFLKQRYNGEIKYKAIL